jgi:alpha-galactosidase
MQALASMASFSDAHEWKAIPVIAANVTRAILPAQSQIWAVLRKEDDSKRLHYSLACTFLGRMCLSGDIYDLTEAQWSIVQEAISLYKECAPVIKAGRNFRFGPHVKSYNHLQGWQAICRQSKAGTQMLVVLHSFEECGDCLTVDLPVEVTKSWKSQEIFCRDGVQAEINGNQLVVHGLQEYDGVVCLLSC